MTASLRPPMVSAERLWTQGTLLAELPGPPRAALLGLGTARSYPAGAHLITEGDRSTDCYLIVEGYAKVVGHSSDGRKVLLGVRVPGDVVGELSATDGGKRSATVLAATAVRARAVSSAQFDGFLGEHRDAWPALHRSTSAKLRLATRHRIEVTGAPVLVRLARVLDRFADAYGTVCDEGVRIEVPLSQSELAALIGAAEPSVHRALLYLRRHQILRTSRLRQVIHDRDLLTALCTDADLPGAVEAQDVLGII